MNTTFQKFYKGLYMRTGGFIPSKPLNQTIYPGDFFQIRNGEMVVLGNIFRKGIVSLDDCELGYGLKLNSANWDFNEGVTKPYSGHDISGHDHHHHHHHHEDDFHHQEEDAPLYEEGVKFIKQVLAFKDVGNYVFKGINPQAIRILNWQDIQQGLIIKMTQTLFSFREVYLVTECATNSSWALAVASDNEAELEIATACESYGLTDIFGLPDVKTIQSKNIEYFHQKDNRVSGFFKAKKLAIHQEKKQIFISDLLSEHTNQEEWATEFFDHDYLKTANSFMPKYNGNMGTSVLDMLQTNQLNPNNALQYFRWEDANLDDIQKLFP